MTATIRVAIADDQELMRNALRMMVDSQPDLDLVGEAADGHEVIALARAHRIDVVLMDIRMPRLNGIEAAQIVTRERPNTRIIALTTFDLDDYAFPALRAGASGFLLKDATAEEIVEAIRVVYAGHGVVAPSTTRRLIEHVATGVHPDDQRLSEIRDLLTPREVDMLIEMASGDSNAEIARRLHVSEATVKTHVGHVLAKLGLRGRVQAVVLAYEIGLVRPGT